MNLHDHITNALRQEPMTLPQIIEAINAQADVAWSPEFLTEQIRIMEWRGHVVKDADGKYSVLLRDGA